LMKKHLSQKSGIAICPNTFALIFICSMILLSNWCWQALMFTCRCPDHHLGAGGQGGSFIPFYPLPLPSSSTWQYPPAY